MEQALAKNPSVARSRAGLLGVEAEKKGTLSAVLPHLSLTGDYQRNSTEISFQSAGSTFLLLPRDDWSGRITLTQPVYAGLRDQKAYRQSRIAVDQAREGVRGAEDAILLRVAADYLSVVQGDALVDVEQKNLDLALKRKKQADDLFEAGESTRVDALRALADVKAAERKLASARRDREAAAGDLRVDLGSESDLRVEDPGPVGLPIPPEAELVSAALADRSEVARSRGDVSVAELEIQKQKGAYLPIVTVEAAYVRQRTDFPIDRYGYAKVNVTVPLFDSGETGSHVAVAREKLKDAQLALEDLRRRVREDVHKAVLDLETSRKSLALSQDQLAASQADYDQAFEQYRDQESTALDVETAEAGLADARRAVVSSRLDATLDELKVWYAAGSLKAAAFKEVHP
jgi:outer membrane protein TolC